MSGTTVGPHPAAADAHGRWRWPAAGPVLAAVTIGATAWWCLGLLPWIRRGLELDVSSAWPAVGAPGGMPDVALPFGEHSLVLLVTLVVTAGLFATGATWLVVRRVWPGLVGGAVAALLALWQTRQVVARGQATTAAADWLVAGLTAATLVAAAAGLLLGVALLRGTPFIRTVAAGLAATLVPAWVNALIIADPIHTTPLQLTALTWTPWLTGIVLAIAFCAHSLASIKAAVAWCLALGIAWVVPALMTALQTVASSARAGSATAAGRRESLDMGLDIARLALAPEHHKWVPLAAAVGVGMTYEVVRRRRQTSQRSDGLGTTS